MLSVVAPAIDRPGNTNGGSITVPLTSCLTGLESAVWQRTIFDFICKTDGSKPVKQKVNGTMILLPLVLPGQADLNRHSPLRLYHRRYAGLASDRTGVRIPSGPPTWDRWCSRRNRRWRCPAGSTARPGWRPAHRTPDSSSERRCYETFFSSSQTMRYSEICKTTKVNQLPKSLLRT